MAPREEWSLERPWSSSFSVNSVLRIEFLLSIFFNDPFSFLSVFCDYLLDSGPSSNNLSTDKLLLF